MFQDFFKAGGDLGELQLHHERTLMNTQAKEAKLIPFLAKDLLIKYHDDADYVAKVKQDCMVRGRVTVDPIVPTDTTKNRYWIEETSYSCVESLSSAIRLQSDLAVTN